METQELKHHENMANTYDLLREVFFNQWNEKTLNTLLKKADLLTGDLKVLPFIKRLHKLDKRSLDEARWDYNRLFIGPKKPLASTFESVYRSEKNIMMREQTFQVREFYKQVGLEVENINQFPDDFIGFEFQYLFYVSLLISELIKREEIEKAQELETIKDEFIKAHPNMWFPEFCNDVKSESSEEIWKELADFILEVLKIEEAQVPFAS